MHRIRSRRLEMVIDHPWCHWCGRQVREYPKKAHERSGKRPPDMATVDHFYSKINGPRPNPGVLLLSCSACNQWRADQETEELGREEVWRRSGRSPNGESRRGSR